MFTTNPTDAAAMSEMLTKAREALRRRHDYWYAGQASCPPELKAPNGELHTLRCKVCGLDNPEDDYCPGAAETVTGVEL